MPRHGTTEQVLSCRILGSDPIKNLRPDPHTIANIKEIRLESFSLKIPDAAPLPPIITVLSFPKLEHGLQKGSRGREIPLIGAWDNSRKVLWSHYPKGKPLLKVDQTTTSLTVQNSEFRVQDGTGADVAFDEIYLWFSITTGEPN